MSKVYSVDILICATAYIRAETAEEAAQIVADMDKSLEFHTGQVIADGLEISGEHYESEDLPEFSLSPAMTAYPAPFPAELVKPKPLTTADFNLVYARYAPGALIIDENHAESIDDFPYVVSHNGEYVDGFASHADALEFIKESTIKNGE